MSEDNKLLLLSIQQTLDETAEHIKNLKHSDNNEDLKLDVEPINNVLNEHFNNMVTLLKSHLDNFNKLTDTETKPTNVVTNKNYSLIGVSDNSSFQFKRIIIVFLILLFLFFTSWLGLHYWFTQGYKMRNQNIAFETLETIKHQNKKRYTKKEILNIYTTLANKNNKNTSKKIKK